MDADQQPTPLEHLEKWQGYAADRSIERRNELVMLYAWMVTKAAQQISNRIFRAQPLCELASAGMDGLIYAVEHYELQRGLKFITYAPARIRGSILDYLRDQDIVPRLVRTHEGAVARAEARLSQQRGKQPTLEELAEDAGVAPEHFTAATQIPVFQSIDSPHWETESGKSVELRHELVNFRDPDLRDQAEVRERVWSIMRGLTKQQRIIVVQYYFNDRTMKQIGAELGLSESRVSQMHSNLIEQLQAAERERQRQRRRSA